MEYNFREIEQTWQKYWSDNEIYKVSEDTTKPKFYVLDMFPYPSGAGLHVGHPLGYIASDIYSRYKRLKGFNVLHPMGYDAFGLPAEQYAIQTGQHPATTTAANIQRYREQLDRIGFSYDWSREICTSDPEYYKWTQWVFIKMFESWFNRESRKAEPITTLIAIFEKEGNVSVDAEHGDVPLFSASEWLQFDDKSRQEVLMQYRLAYIGDTFVNWCAELGTVLANDEVKEGLSVRGGFPVVQKKMRQWQLRVSAYGERLLNGLDTLEWSDSLKETQRNWIGRSEGAEMQFKIADCKENLSVEIFTTRPDTIFGVSFMVLAPESDWVDRLTTPQMREAVDAYLVESKKKTERERIAETKLPTGVFTGSYAVNPISNEKIPIWISDYVLSGYGTGAIMAVPAHDSRDYAFAKKFNLPIVCIIEGADVSESSFDAKSGRLINSGFLNGLDVKEAISAALKEIEGRGIGKRKVNFRLRDAIFSRQRYWGEPFPIYYKDGIATPIEISDLPLRLPDVDKFLPTESGEPPLARAKNWSYRGYPLETSTMPGFAGSSAYYLRYMDPNNNTGLISRESDEYWRSVDLYIGGIEHATGHLIYSRFWNKFLFDIGVVCEEEPFSKLVNQGMIQGRSNFVYRVKGTNKFVSLGLKDNYETTEIHVDVNIVSNDRLDISKFRQWMPEYLDAEFILENGEYLCGWAVEKMSKSMYNVVNPDYICENYGADTLRMYEMFLGPLEQSKPWDTNGIDGVHRFLKRFWKIFIEDDSLSKDAPTKDELKILHKLIHKIETDIEQFSFNTSISSFMIALNELQEKNCRKESVFEPFLILLSPFAPHICEELWHRLGHKQSIVCATFPRYDATHTVETDFEYPVSFNGKLRYKLSLALSLTKEEVIDAVTKHPDTDKYLAGSQIKKIIVVPNKIINIVC